MDWESLLKLFSLEPKVESKGKGNQLGIYVKNENSNNTYFTVVNLENPEVAKAFAKELQKPETEEKVKEVTRHKLKPLDLVISSLKPSTQEEIISKTMGLSAIGELDLKSENETIVFAAGKGED